MSKRKYRLRIPSLTTLWTYVEAKDEDEAIDILVKRINSKTVNYSDKRVWQVEPLKAGDE